MTSQPARKEPGPGAAAIRIESGSASPEEVAALTAVLAVVGGGSSEPPQRRPSAWSDPSWRLVGPSARRGGWASSSLPRR
ncbi:MAG TPA: acyl-CoA carboxylase subunit epsilon [Intrasporangium sp.]|uniref:acyl-CoA carboxylase subunit epsilon n=1 Tax=Intrasporangium sp. TaxID=1925024 RepID=UPI002B498547|nr:acyl-CoA carboxylase subunit epsilon [Intrasporangium sp.]HKX68339.1 acyl-CoA carboxylase subunit epsilon [Intrasporangium sp.]